MKQPIDLSEAAEDAVIGAFGLASVDGVRHIPAAGGKVLIAARFRLAVPDRFVFQPDGGQFGDILKTDDDVAEIGDRRVAVVEVELLPEFFRGVAVHPLDAVLDGVGRAAVAGERVGAFLRRHRRHCDHPASRSIDAHEISPTILTATGGCEL